MVVIEALTERLKLWFKFYIETNIFHLFCWNVADFVVSYECIRLGRSAVRALDWRFLNRDMMLGYSVPFHNELQDHRGTPSLLVLQDHRGTPSLLGRNRIFWGVRRWANWMRLSRTPVAGRRADHPWHLVLLCLIFRQHLFLFFSYNALNPMLWAFSRHGSNRRKFFDRSTATSVCKWCSIWMDWIETRSSPKVQSYDRYFSTCEWFSRTYKRNCSYNTVCWLFQVTWFLFVF